MIHEVTPNYGTIIRRTGVNGAVFFRALVGCNGNVESVTIVSGPEALRQTTVDAVKQWTYRPYLIDGKKVSVDLSMGISESFGAEVLFETVSPGRVRVSSGVMAGQLLSRIEPIIPTLPLDAKVSGATVLRAVIGRDGRVLELTPISGPELLRGPVMGAVRQWRYRPFLIDGTPVEVETTVTLNIDFGH
ncbi:outer membrane biosynthesis protein TonB [Granulicella aggregans]|uniref:Outer membrane biosynthesis protein TonB n=1 Tax=Granulicella aggregans TaxID=474949 RepID=A0A7W8E766_9BACT|nr:energy transducer TonB [Granulicella aggregans]MBB5061382.1 outer membrane biosynthesis protein TonB [Granulicella aggregans]